MARQWVTTPRKPLAGSGPGARCALRSFHSLQCLAGESRRLSLPPAHSVRGSVARVPGAGQPLSVPPEAYDWLYDLLDDRRAVDGASPAVVPPREVADEIVNAASATQPPARIPVGPVANAGIYARFLPTWAYDGAIRLVRKFV